MTHTTETHPPRAMTRQQGFSLVELAISLTLIAVLSAVQVAFQGCEDQIMRSRTPGFMQMLTHSHRYVVPVQMRMYDGKPRELV